MRIYNDVGDDIKVGLFSFYSSNFCSVLVLHIILCKHGEKLHYEYGHTFVPPDRVGTHTENISKMKELCVVYLPHDSIHHVLHSPYKHPLNLKDVTYFTEDFINKQNILMEMVKLPKKTSIENIVRTMMGYVI